MYLIAKWLRGRPVKWYSNTVDKNHCWLWRELWNWIHEVNVEIFLHKTSYWRISPSITFILNSQLSICITSYMNIMMTILLIGKQTKFESPSSYIWIDILMLSASSTVKYHNNSIKPPCHVTDKHSTCQHFTLSRFTTSSFVVSSS